jgi:hypothetical protein
LVWVPYIWLLIKNNSSRSRKISICKIASTGCGNGNSALGRAVADHHNCKMEYSHIPFYNFRIRDLICARELENKTVNINLTNMQQMRQYMVLFHNIICIKHPKYAQINFLAQSSASIVMKEGSSNTIVAGSTSGDTTAHLFFPFASSKASSSISSTASWP